MGDLDILVHPDDERQVYDALVNDGWTAPPGVEDYGNRHHVVMGKNGVSLERHYTLPMVDRERIRAFWDGFVSRTDKDGCVLSWE